ncbi:MULTISPECIES: helix-turn-helix transcriptional regulator [unclassified Herbaspirillum]|uniref:helix-turn-helix domain-containing protein n=1 Tax=unclassified Herbaspirillum TaxID=2624150 RepID=UPI000E2F520A|nr:MULTISPECIES: helix-turn-helix transcriptional regulator [unclassified Herbaspirillum]RFB74307.1 XRE family transcriptional regulator [Herbaspirillum sp. 3R-3a1]TFI10529.1 XRE family transcriptional regulator [Herbaspirillum sp. 3R11]TFI16434.1 XRE family transcriptional regulator [Herbaspirillum sp. 3R-11]TFI26649.1 XRE family transcriptional regulator [Herbaspirillum sp. 3C11]TFI26674.1 XRE family transcriptional regulator [Herbaspirillum sp. 3C11]
MITTSPLTTTPSRAAARSASDLLREWRLRRRMSQLDLACEAEISTRHLSFLETGRSQPSREMLLRLAERLEIPLRERNALLMAGGFAPLFPERALDDPALLAARAAIEQILTGHEPFPALAIDRHWNLVSANRVIPLLLTGVAPELLAAPVNVMRLSLHPQGLAPRIVNFPEWRRHLLDRLRQQIALSADPVLIDLMKELQSYPEPAGTDANEHPASPYAAVAVPFQLATDGGVLSFFSTTTIFGTPVDITLSELAMECFFPANAETSAALRALLPD